jgi:hypothetical protein
MLRSEAHLRTDVSEEHSASIIRLARISALRTTLAVISNRRNIPEDGILHSHRRENLKSYISLTNWILQWRRNVSPVKYELGFYIPEDDILYSQP